jgi:hypothetical protein
MSDDFDEEMESVNRDEWFRSGVRHAWLDVIKTALSHIPGHEDEAKFDWMIERQEAIEKLRELCDEFGDNDWPDELHLADVIEKHLAGHLYSREDEP